MICQGQVHRVVRSQNPAVRNPNQDHQVVAAAVAAHHPALQVLMTKKRRNDKTMELVIYEESLSRSTGYKTANPSFLIVDTSRLLRITDLSSYGWFDFHYLSALFPLEKILDIILYCSSLSVQHIVFCFTFLHHQLQCFDLHSQRFGSSF